MTPQDISQFFLDESGHSGDLAKAERGLDFLDQPYFVLGAVGVPGGPDVGSELAALRATHRLPPGELKSKSLNSKPAFVEAVFDMVLRRELPVLLEVVDKRYYIGTQVVQFMLRHGLSREEGPALHTALNILAEVIFQEAPDDVLTGYIEACVEPSDEAVMTVFGRLFLLEVAAPKRPENGRAMQMLTEVAKAAGVSYYQARMSNPSVFEEYVPTADFSRTGKAVRMLPNQTCFTNICARVNLLRGRRFSGVRFVHDEQLETAKIIHDSKAQMEAFKNTGFRPYTPHADYIIEDGALLEFAKSDVEPGIQIADILTGTAMRFCRDLARDPGAIRPEIKRAMGKIVATSDPVTGLGVNFVAPDQLVHACLALGAGLEPTSPAAARPGKTHR